jgi:molybdopterin converting factor small subunit
MTTVRIPTPLRPYTGGNGSVTVAGATVGQALDDLTTQYPTLRPHLYDGEALRSFVNIYLNKEDVRGLDGPATAVSDNDTLMIIPSIAGGAPAADRKVDQNALRVNQTFIIGFLALAFVLNAPWIVAFVAAVMLLGTAVPSLSLFKGVYQYGLKPAGIVKPNVILDNPEPHRFAQGFGGVVLVGAAAALFSGATTLGWVLVGLVVVLAALNLFLGFCAGCFVYYQLNRFGVPGFAHSPLKQS